MTEDRKLKLTALLLALLLWLYVSGLGWPIFGLVDNDPERKVISIPLQVENLSEGLETNLLPEKVRVGIIDPDSSEEELQNYLGAFLDLGYAVPGEYLFPVVLDNPQGWEIDYVSPESIQVRVREKEQ